MRGRCTSKDHIPPTRSCPALVDVPWTKAFERGGRLAQRLQRLSGGTMGEVVGEMSARVIVFCFFVGGSSEVVVVEEVIDCLICGPRDTRGQFM